MPMKKSERRGHSYPDRTMAVSQDLEERRQVLASWVARKLGVPGVQISPLQPPAGNGASSETYLFDVDAMVGSAHVCYPLVARFEPEGPGVYPEYDIQRQYAMLRDLRDRTAIPVPSVRWVEL